MRPRHDYELRNSDGFTIRCNTRPGAMVRRATGYDGGRKVNPDGQPTTRGPTWDARVSAALALYATVESELDGRVVLLSDEGIEELTRLREAAERMLVNR